MENKLTTNTTPETDEISKIYWSGNTIPPSWYRHIRYKTKKNREYCDHLAVNLLGEIVYWYRNTEKKDESTMEVVSISKKFTGDIWQISYNAIEKKFGCSRSQAQSAIDLLVELQLVKKVFRDKDIGDIGRVRNIMFIIPIAENIKIITYNSKEIKNKEMGMGKNTDTSSQKNEHDTENLPIRNGKKASITGITTEDSSTDSTTIRSKENIVAPDGTTNHTPDSKKEKPAKQSIRTGVPTKYTGMTLEQLKTVKCNSIQDKIHWVVTYLNLVNKSEYYAQTQNTNAILKARLEEGYTGADFKRVIDYKHKEWHNDPEYAKYIRPATLFGSKFENYLECAKKDIPTIAKQYEDLQPHSNGQYVNAKSDQFMDEETD